MITTDEIAATLKNMDDGMLIERWNLQLFSEEAMPIAIAEFQRRGLELPIRDVTASKKVRDGKSSYIALRVIRAICGFVAAWQVVGLLPVIGWLSNLSATTGGMWAFVFFKLLVMLIFGLAFFWLRALINRLNMNKHGRPHPAMYTQWTL